MTVNKMIKDLDVVDAFAPISNNKLNGVVGGDAWKNFWSSLRKGFYDGEAGRANPSLINGLKLRRAYSGNQINY